MDLRGCLVKMSHFGAFAANITFDQIASKILPDLLLAHYTIFLHRISIVKLHHYQLEICILK